MNQIIWNDLKNFNDVFWVVHFAFLGWITSSMRAAYIANKTRDRLELVILFNKQPLKIDDKIVHGEILMTIKDSVSDYGIFEVDYRPIVIDGTISGFKEKGGGWIRRYWPIFQKYDFMSYDLDD